jgi:mono/diheme cytochrome c family protein
MTNSPRAPTSLVGSIIIVLLGWIPLGLNAGQPQTTRDGVFSDAQAKRGEALYGQQCVSCHAGDLSGSGAPALAGTEFLSSWDKMPVADLVDKIATSMPSSSPGSLSRVQASDLVAFILKSNNFPAGSADLSADAAALKTINIVR